MSWDTRLVYIGLWSYVDDNGVGRDIERLITTDLFALDDDLTEASVRVHGALKHLNTHGQITRYSVDGRRFLHITAWNRHQKINRPTASRYPLPTSADIEVHGGLTEDSLSPQVNAPLGEGEKGRRGEEQTHAHARATDAADATSEPPRPIHPERFDEFWNAYPKKVSKGTAIRAWKAATKRSDADTILTGLTAQLPAMRDCERRFIANPATWLNGDRWADELTPSRNTNIPEAW